MAAYLAMVSIPAIVGCVLGTVLVLAIGVVSSTSRSRRCAAST
jgi:hypothetical protein